MRKAIVVGSGAGGATVAKELQGHYEVTVLEAGKEFKPFGMELERLEMLRQFGLFFDEREIQFVIPAFKTRRATDEMILVNGIGLGGTTTICTGNALRLDGDLKALGIDLRQVYGQTECCGIATTHAGDDVRPETVGTQDRATRSG